MTPPCLPCEPRTCELAEQDTQAACPEHLRGGQVLEPPGQGSHGAEAVRAPGRTASLFYRLSTWPTPPGLRLGDNEQRRQQRGSLDSPRGRAFSDPWGLLEWWRARRPAPRSSLSANRPHAHGSEGRGPSGPQLRAPKREVAGSFHPRPQPRGASFQGSQPCFPAAGPPDSHSQAGPLSPELAQHSGSKCSAALVPGTTDTRQGPAPLAPAGPSTGPDFSGLAACRLPSRSFRCQPCRWCRRLVTP